MTGAVSSYRGDRLLRRTLLVAAGLLATLIPVSPAGAMTPERGPQAAAAPAVCDAFRARNVYREESIRNYSGPRTYTNSAAWATASCGTSSFTVPFGRRAYAVVRVGAESDCFGSSPANQWCQARVLVNNVEANPVGSEPDSFAFDSNNGGQFDWQAHSFTRARPVFFGCGARTGCTYRVVLQYKVHAAGLSLWIDEQTLEVDVTYV
jgi:hypothetical protein